MGRRRQKPAADDEHPVDLAGAQAGPGGLILFGDIEDIVVLALHATEPFRGRGQGRLVDDLTGEAHRLNGRADPLDEGPDRAGAGRDEAEDAGFRGAAGAFAGAVDHQARQFDHQVGFGAGGLEKGLAREGQDFAVAQGDHGGGVGRAGQHGHFAHRLARLDHAQQMGRLIRLQPKDAETARAQQIEGVGRIALGKQRLAPGQGEPAGPVDHPPFENAGEGRRQGVGTRRGHDERCRRDSRAGELGACRRAEAASRFRSEVDGGLGGAPGLRPECDCGVTVSTKDGRSARKVGLQARGVERWRSYRLTP